MSTSNNILDKDSAEETRPFLDSQSTATMEDISVPSPPPTSEEDEIASLPTTTSDASSTPGATYSIPIGGGGAMSHSSPASTRSYDSLTYSITSEEASHYFKDARYQHPMNYNSHHSNASMVSGLSSNSFLSSEHLSQSNLQQPRDRSGLPPRYNYGSSNVYRPKTMIDSILQSQSRNGESVMERQDSQLNNSPTAVQTRYCISPRVVFTLCVCGVILGNLILGGGGRRLLEEWWELGVKGLHGQRTASLVQAKLVPKIKLDLKPLKLKNENEMKGKHGKEENTEEITGCEATIMLIRHCEKGKLRSHCSFMGYERAAYLSTLFGDDKRWPAPDQIYALNKGRTHKLNFREVETVQAISDTVHVPINAEYSTDETKDLSKVLLEQLLEGELCGKLILVSWQHSDIPRLAQHLGCGPLQGCPWDYKGSVFDNTWQIRYVFTDFYDSKTGQAKKKWNIFGSVQPENFDPLAFSKSVGDYPPGGTTHGSSLAQWGQDGNFVFYG